MQYCFQIIKPKKFRSKVYSVVHGIVFPVPTLLPLVIRSVGTVPLPCDHSVHWRLLSEMAISIRRLLFQHFPSPPPLHVFCTTADVNLSEFRRS